MIPKSSKHIWASLSSCLAGSVLLALVGCSPASKAHQLPSKLLSPPSPDKREPRREDMQALREFTFRAVLKTALLPSQDNRHVDALGMYRQAAMAAWAAEGQTLESICRGIGLEDKRTDRLASSLQSRLGAWYSPNSGIRSAGSWWMIWPISVTPEFQAKAASQMGVHVKRLGSAGVGAQSEIGAWLRLQLGGAATADLPLTKEIPMASILSFTAEGSWKSPMKGAGLLPFNTGTGPRKTPFILAEGELKGGETPWGEASSFPSRDKAWELLLLKPPLGKEKEALQSLSQGALPDLLSKMRPGQKKALLPEVALNTLDSPDAILETVGLGALAAPGADLRYLSLEARGLPAPLWQQRFRLSWGANGLGDEAEGLAQSGSAAAPLIFDRPFLWLLFDPKEKVVFAGGMIRNPGSR